jgi:hypothetical protein
MTAEIAILNKHGVALAADSAVTFTMENNQKVFNSANKLFALSQKHPVGIMVYGSAQFMNIPWEIIIKKYRRQLNENYFEKLEDYCRDFVNFIKNDAILKEHYSYQESLYRTLNTYLQIFLNQVGNKMNSIPNENRNESIVRSYIEKEVDNFFEILDKIQYIEEFDENFIKEFVTKNNDLLEQVIRSNIFVNIDDNLSKKIKKLIISMLAKELFTSLDSGIVISGYGENELFPSLREYKFAGVFDGKLKYKLESCETISSEVTNSSSTAAIKAFAQNEMVMTFLNGVDPYFFNEIFGSVNTILQQEYPLILTQNLGIQLTQQQQQRLALISEQIFQNIVTKVREFQIKNYNKPILDTVEFLPKEELASMAEALLNLTSLKRRVTMETETVGGPIDVAIISKTDGFIWIKRKHYFKPELNPRYFKNYN